ncbi:MAG: 30S ribosomal protein S27ae [archaeon]
MAKKQKKKKQTSAVWKNYDSSSGLKRKNKVCPKCGDGHFLANHKDRISCGKCGYMEKK